MLVPAYCKFAILREFKILWEYKKESTKLLLMILWSLQLSGKWQWDMKIWRDFTWFPFLTLTYLCTNRVISNYRPSGRDNSAHTGGWVLSGCPSGSPGGQEMSVTPPDGDPQPSRAWSSHQITKHSEQPLLAGQGKASVPAKVYKLILKLWMLSRARPWCCIVYCCLLNLWSVLVGRTLGNIQFSEF